MVDTRARPFPANMKTINAIAILSVIVLFAFGHIEPARIGGERAGGRTPKERRSASSDGDGDGYVVEDMTQVQQDQPAFMRPPPYTYSRMQKESTMQDKSEQRKRILGALPANVQFTKEISIKQGRLKGIVRSMDPRTGLKNVRQYLGIPYAAAPIGNGRFMPPGAPPPWNGLRMAVELSPVCPQNLPSLNNSNQHLTTGRYNQLKRLIQYLQNESEDCLFLSLYVPEWSGIGPRPIYPVMVFIHGESFEWNSGNAYDGSILSSYGQVIVVTLNYRLGILGFLKPGTSTNTASNFGLLDQIAALQWVKDNIAAFGGDVGSVTLMGHTTGAACVNLLMLSPVAQGLFHRAILMSGSAMSDWAISSNPLQATTQVLQSLDCPMRFDNDEVLACLRKKRYQDILEVRVSSPEFTTTFGPSVDNLYIPNEPQKMMQHLQGGFNSYDLLFGLTEIESYNAINAIGIMHGLLENERDGYLKFYVQNRFDVRPDIAMDLTLREYSNIYTNPKKAVPEEHRDVVLEVLSDAGTAAPLFQTGVYHSRASNPSTYMYLFSHISKAGDYPNLVQSITGEELPYIFGAPLAYARPFPSSFGPAERLLAEEMMVYFTNFAKTGNPKAPRRDHFLNMEPSNWEQYDIDWPPFKPANFNYLNIGIPPVVAKNYRQQYMDFWNRVLPDQLSGNPSRTDASGDRSPLDNATAYVRPLVPHVNYYLEKSTENPIRQLQYLLHHTGPNRSDMYQTQSTVEMPKIYDAVTASPENTFMLGDNNQIVVKADSTLNVLIAMIVVFLVINVIILSIYLVRRNYFKRNLKRKLDVLSLDGTTDDELKRSNKYNDGDESFILDIVRRKNEYVPVKRYHSPINGFLLTRHFSTSTVDTHTKVSDWITQEVNRQSPQLRSKSPSFSYGTSGGYQFGGRPDERPAGATATLGHEHAPRRPPDLMRSRSFELRPSDAGPACHDFGPALFDKAASSARASPDCMLQIELPDTADALDAAAAPHADEQVTSFIEDGDVNVTSRDECDGAPFRLTAEETLQVIQMRNYPKVLPKYPIASSDYVSSSSFKRRSVPSIQYLAGAYARMIPVPPPRTSSTLDRRQLVRQSDSNSSDPTPLRPVMVRQMADNGSIIDEEPEITYNALHVGPLLPGSKENLYSTIQRKKAGDSADYSPCIIEAQIENLLARDTDGNESELNRGLINGDAETMNGGAAQPFGLKSIMKRPTLATMATISDADTLSDEIYSTPPTPQVLNTSKIPVLSRFSGATSLKSNHCNSNGKSADKSSSDSSGEAMAELKQHRSATSITSSTGTSSSDAETIKHIF